MTTMRVSLAGQAGWVAAEVGRQPWVVYPSVQNGVEMQGLRTKDAVSESIKAEQVWWSIAMFGLIYLFLFVVWVRVLHAKIVHGPDEPREHPPAPTGGPGGRGGRGGRGFIEAGAVLAGHEGSFTKDEGDARRKEPPGR